MMSKESISANDYALHVYTADDERFWTYSVRGTPQTIESRYTVRDLGGKALRTFKELNGYFTHERDYVHRDGLLLATITPAETQHLSLDHLGSPRIATNDNGEIVAKHTYWPFGTEWTTPSDAADGNVMKFTGHERYSSLPSDARALDYMHARYYSAHLGRFMSVDPKLDVKRGLRNPPRWHRYSYALGNPLKLLDPDGMAPEAFLLVTGKRLARRWDAAQLPQPLA
jgi:RHS repeat-associated protein